MDQNSNSRPVYSTGSAQTCPDCFMPISDCICEKVNGTITGGGIAKIRREIKGRKGKTVTTISGLEMTEEALRQLASELKQSCGTGGSIKDRIILIQGDRIKQVKSFLENKGFKVKQTGG